MVFVFEVARRLWKDALLILEGSDLAPTQNFGGVASDNYHVISGNLPPTNRFFKSGMLSVRKNKRVHEVDSHLSCLYHLLKSEQTSVQATKLCFQLHFA
jgi:hypothetical protein